MFVFEFPYFAADRFEKVVHVIVSLSATCFFCVSWHWRSGEQPKSLDRELYTLARKCTERHHQMNEVKYIQISEIKICFGVLQIMLHLYKKREILLLIERKTLKTPDFNDACGIGHCLCHLNDEPTLFLHRYHHACHQSPHQGGQAGPTQRPQVWLPAPNCGRTQHQLLPSTGDIRCQLPLCVLFRNRPPQGANYRYVVPVSY